MLTWQGVLGAQVNGTVVAPSHRHQSASSKRMVDASRTQRLACTGMAFVKAWHFTGSRAHMAGRTSSWVQLAGAGGGGGGERVLARRPMPSGSFVYLPRRLSLRGAAPCVLECFGTSWCVGLYRSTATRPHPAAPAHLRPAPGPHMAAEVLAPLQVRGPAVCRVRHVLIGTCSR